MYDTSLGPSQVGKTGLSHCCFLIAVSNTLTAKSTSSLVMHIGGLIRNICKIRPVKCKIGSYSGSEN